MRKGSNGDEVKKLQESLISAGYDVGASGADGVYGDNTESAVRKYQQDNGLDVDGVAGEQTLGKLYNTGSTNNTGVNVQNTPQANTPQYGYDPATDSAYQNAMSALQQAQQQMPQYSGKYDAQLQDIYNQIVGRDKFSYNLNEDAMFRQYQDQYVNQGRMAMMDTMGQAAQLTGGYGNSYASTAGNQAFQGYLQQLNNVMPELYGMALDQYNQEGQNLLNQYSMMHGMAQDEYGKYQDSLNQYWQNVNYQKDLADDAYNRGYENWYNTYQNQYQAERDKVADEQWQKEYDFALRQYEDSLARASYGGGSSGDGNGRSVDGTRELTKDDESRYDTLWGTVTTEDRAEALVRQMEREGYSEDVIMSYYAIWKEELSKDRATAKVDSSKGIRKVIGGVGGSSFDRVALY